MKIQLLDLRGQYSSIKKEVDDAVSGVIARQDFILGKEVTDLEREIAAFCGTKCAVGVASGTDALILSLKALGIGEGDEVITTPFTFFATAETVSLAGARPVFVDIDPGTYNIDPSLIEKKITPRTKAIMPVHLYGQCADMDPIMAIAARRGLKVIEDNAQAIGATYKGRKAGSVGDVGALSFFPSKNLGAFGDAGMVVTNDERLAEAIRVLRVHGSSVRYIHSVIGMNSRIDNLQAAVLRIKLKYLDVWLRTRREIAEFYNKKLHVLPLTCPYVPAYNVHTYHQYTLRIKDGRDELMKHLLDNGIETRTYYPIPLHLQKCYSGLGYKEGDFPESETAALETFVLPIYPEISSEAKDYIVRIISGFFSK